MRKKIAVITLTALLFLSGVILGVATVFRVGGVAVEATLISQEARTEAAALEEALEKAYKGDGIFSVERNKADEIMENFPYFRITAFKRAYPNRIFIKISEDAEVYAVENAEGNYYILGGNGTVLGIRENFDNRLDGAENVLIKGLTVTGEKGGALTGDASVKSVLALCQGMDKALDGIRRNVLSVEILMRSPESIYSVTMREGVKIYFHNPEALTEQKAQKAIEKYLSLSEKERMMGRIAVMDVEGSVLVDYAEKDEFQ